MIINLNRIRYQETYGEQVGEYLAETVTSEETLDVLKGYASRWFPDGHALEQDPDSSNTWVLTEGADEGRKVFFFVESIG